MSDNDKYQNWIWDTYGDTTGYGKCDVRTEEMVAAFPELRRARGFYHCPSWGPRTHWWCLTADGTVVDPSCRQFPSGGAGRYQELEEDELPTGVCPDCGGFCFKEEPFCSDSCKTSYLNYLKTGVL